MILRLDEFDIHKYEKEFDLSVTFGFFNGDRAELLKVVAQVQEEWPKYFEEGDSVLRWNKNGIL